jgi:Holliday junction DNA helicase RuvA
VYSYFIGKVEEVLADKVIIETNNIGYEINVLESEIKTYENQKDEIIKIYTYFQVREDDMRLYGFLTKNKLWFFKKLISVSGVGPKVAMGIISNISVEDMCIAIATENILTLKSVPGIGPKMAQKIIFELKDKVVKEQMESISGKDTMKTINKENKEINEAKEALQALGFAEKVIDSIIVKLGINNEPVEIVIKKVLKELQR